MTTHNYHWPFHSDDELNAVRKVLSSGYTNYWTGLECHEFEKEFSEFIGTKYAIALMNGTVALESALYALDIGSGDEVITSCRTFLASASCIVSRGATPILADVDRESQNITSATIEPCITPRTKAIIVVHLAGWPAKMDSIMALAEKYNLYVIEDCAQSMGAIYKNRRVGSWGHVAAFSFCQDKIMTTGGEGGMITTDNEEIWQKIWSFKDHGKNYSKVYHHLHPVGFRWLHDSFGTNFRMTEMQAAIGRVQLKKLLEWLVIRNKNASLLNEKFKNHSILRLTYPSDDIYHAYYKYYVFIRPEWLKKGWSRDRIMQEANELGIPCFVGSCSDIGLEQAFKKMESIKSVSSKALVNKRPIAKQLGETSLMFLVHPTLTSEEMQKRANKLSELFELAAEKSQMNEGESSLVQA
jgi:dTDP-4-amino-4,6-dideoxygalactose transaminase